MEKCRILDPISKEEYCNVTPDITNDPIEDLISSARSIYATKKSILKVGSDEVTVDGEVAFGKLTNPLLRRFRLFKAIERPKSTFCIRLGFLLLGVSLTILFVILSFLFAGNSDQHAPSVVVLIFLSLAILTLLVTGAFGYYFKRKEDIPLLPIFERVANEGATMEELLRIATLYEFKYIKYNIPSPMFDSLKSRNSLEISSEFIPEKMKYKIGDKEFVIDKP